MAINYINLEIAKKLMSLRTTNGTHSSIVTVWDSRPILVVWNHMADDVAFQTWSDNIVAEEDKEELRKMVRGFLVKENKLTFR